MPEVIESTASEGSPAEAPEAPPAEPIVPEPEAEPPAPEAEEIRPELLPARQGAVGSAIPDLPVIPQQSEMTSIAQLAVTLSAASACPSAMRGKPNDVFLVLLSARDLGVSLTTAMREFHVIEGKVTLSPKVKLALVRQAGLGKIWPDAANGVEKATWHAERHDLQGHVISSSFSWEDAQLAHLVDSRCRPLEHWRGEGRGSGRNSAECLCKSNWKTYPARMLSWRAAGYLLDDLFPEVGTGLYSPDELGAVTDAEGEPIEVRAAEALPGMRGGQRQQQAAAPEAIEPEKLEELKARTERVKGHAEANADLRAWWAERELPPIARISAPQGRLLEAKLAQVESRFGIQAEPAGAAEAAAQQGGGEQPAQEPQEGSEPQQAEEPPASAPGSEERPIEPPQPPPAPPQEEPSAGPSDGDVAAWLIEQASAMDAAAVKASYIAAGLEPPKGNVNLLRRSWAMWQFERLALATASILSLGTATEEQLAEALEAAKAGAAG